MTIGSSDVCHLSLLSLSQASQIVTLLAQVDIATRTGRSSGGFAYLRARVLFDGEIDVAKGALPDLILHSVAVHGDDDDDDDAAKQAMMLRVRGRKMAKPKRLSKNRKVKGTPTSSR